jgi:LysR family hydrogen peroxide-inducible transcriptional activator
LPAVVPILRKKFRNLRLFLQEDRTARLVELTSRGRLDLCLLALEADLGALETRALFFDPFVLALPADHKLASRKKVREQELADEEVLLLADGHCLRDQALAICSRGGAQELGDFRATSLNTLVRMVAGGTGITLLPAMAVSQEIQARDRLSAVALERGGRTIGFAWRRSSPRIRAYELLTQVFLENAPKGTVELPKARAELS